MTASLTPPIKWHGGKHYLAPQLWEMAKAVPHIHRVEPYAGGLAFTLASDPEGYSEVVNDINGELTDFWTVLQTEETFGQFKRLCEATPCSETEFKRACNADPYGTWGDVCRAHAFFVRCRQSRAATFKDFTTIAKTRTRRRMNELPSAWLTAIEGLPAIHARLKRVVILNRDAIEVIRTQDGSQTLFYCDPPYLHETRATKDAYAHEMTPEQHAQLLNVLAGIAGKFMLSGYFSDRYHEMAVLHGWSRRDFDLPNNAAGGDAKRRMTECVWSNF